MPEMTTDEVHKNGPAHVSSFGLSVTPQTQDAANPDTAAATLAVLETEVNQIKATLRRFGLIAP